jgi:MFS family permease
MLISAIYSLMFTIYAGLGFLVGSLFAIYGYKSFEISMAGMIFVACGTIAVFCFGIYLDRTNKYLFGLRMISVTSTISMASSMLLIPTGNIWCAIFFCAIAGSCIIPIVPVCFALATEVTHPVQPAMVLGLLANFANLMLFVMDLVYISFLSVNNPRPILCLAVMTINPLLCIFISMFVKEDLRRINAHLDLSSMD